jgi:colanic acid biosynthesis glycosyl transferase WcaI
VVFALVGDGARRTWLETEVARRSLGNVRLLGYQPRERMPEINASSDLGTIPMMRTSTSDTFPSKIYTIMACGKPVVVSADPDSELAWLVQQADCGRVIPPEDPRAYTEAIAEAFADRARLPAAGERGRAFVAQEYSKQVVGLAYARLVDKILQPRAR